MPVVVADLDGERYLVAMLGKRVNWVRNVRAAGGAAVLHHGARTAVHLEEVPVAERAPILKRYLELAPGARAHIPVDRHAPVAEFRADRRRLPGLPDRRGLTAAQVGVIDRVSRRRPSSERAVASRSADGVPYSVVR